MESTMGHRMQNDGRASVEAPAVMPAPATSLRRRFIDNVDERTSMIVRNPAPDASPPSSLLGGSKVFSIIW